MKNLDWKSWRIDALGAGMFLTVALAGYGLFVHHAMTDALAKKSTIEDLHAARAAFDSVQNTYTLQQRKVDNVQHRLQRNRAALLRPRAADGFLSQLNEIASQCGVQVARWQPEGGLQHEHFQTEGFWIEGRGSFPAIYRWMALIEAGVPFLDMTHFSIQSLRNGEEETCTFKCSLISYSAPQDEEQMAAAQP
jgi:hypothetical protein